MLRLSFKVYEAVFALEKKRGLFRKKKKNILIFFKSFPTRHIKYKRMNFFPINMKNMTKSLFQPIWNYFYEGLNIRLLINSAKYIAR